MLNFVMVGLGGAFGSMARFWVSTAIVKRFGETFPFGTLFVNVSGSFLIGFLAALPLSPSWRVLLMAGLCGGYTTFSAFSLENLRLLREGNVRAAALNAAASLIFCMVAVWLGYSTGLSMKINSAR